MKLKNIAKTLKSTNINAASVGNFQESKWHLFIWVRSPFLGFLDVVKVLPGHLEETQ